MKVTIVNCFDTYEHRVDLLYDYFVKKGHFVSVIESDFRHFQKVKRTDKKQDFTFINVKPYYKNMSASRLISHSKFAKDAFKLVEQQEPDLVYVLIPPNSLAKVASQYKKKHLRTKLIFDLIDLWPETMPIAKFKNIFPFTYWKNLRDNNLKAADYIITECDLYQEVLKDALDSVKTKTLYLARPVKEFNSKPVLDEDSISLCYLGSINNIIDIPFIARIIKEISKCKPVKLKIIGDGEQKDALIKSAEEANAEVIFYGKVYDPVEKQKIFDTCHFGLNIMKDTVCVGLTMKSIDYFEAGLPIINNIAEDSSKIVEQYGIGFNVNEECVAKTSDDVLSVKVEDLLKMRTVTRNLFETMFSEERFRESLDIVLEEF